MYVYFPISSPFFFPSTCTPLHFVFLFRKSLPNTHVTNDNFLPSSFLFVCVQSVSSNPIYPKFITSFIRKS